MKTRRRPLSCRLAFAWGLALLAHAVQAQQMPDLGFTSVGRGAAVADAQQYPVVGPIQMFGVLDAVAARDGAVPDGVTPLEHDIFNTPDFYQDEALWMDPRYWRCNAGLPLEAQAGAYPGPVMIGDDPERTAAWGFCDRDYPREQIVSPYGFTSAQEHYEALLAESKQRGTWVDHGPETLPWDINGHYMWSEGGPGGLRGTWYSMVSVQIPTVLSLLTPTYQQRLVQEAYHQAHGQSQWPSQYCWPEGFMRRYHFAATLMQAHTVMVNPDVVQIMAGVARNFVTNIHLGREFITDGAVPRLGQDVPRWYGETIGFWDGEVLVSWTSNIQGWMAHSAFEFSSKMQSIEIYTPVRDTSGAITALNHEAILYDPEALVEPVRIVRNLTRMSSLSEGDPYTYIECVPTIYPVEGVASPKSPGDRFEFWVPDMYGRPWSQIWEEFHEDGMQKPQDEVDIFSFE